MSPRPDQPDSDPTVPETSDGNAPAGNAAERIIEKFGGIRPMAHKLEVPVTTVQGWKKRGAIPSARHPDLLAAAGRHNIQIDQAELDAAAPPDERGGEDALGETAGTPLVTPPPAGAESERGLEATPADAGAATTAEQPAAARAYDDETRTEPPRAASERQPEAAASSGGGRGLATFAILLALLGTGAAITAPMWAPDVLPQIWGPRVPAVAPDAVAPDAVDPQRVAALEERVQQLAERPEAVEVPTNGEALAGRIEQLEQQLAQFEQRVAEPANGVDPAQVQQLANRVQQLEQRPQPQPGIDRQALDQRLVPVEQQLLAVAQVREQVQTLTGQVQDAFRTMDGRLNALEQDAQMVRQLSQSIVGLEQEANRLSQEIAQVNTQTAEMARNLTAQQRAESANQALVLAATQLRSALQTPGPFATELAAVRPLRIEDPQLVQALQTIEPRANTGIPTEAQLRDRFNQIAGDIVRTDVVGRGGEWWDQALARASSVVNVRRVAGDIEGTGTDAIVGRAEARLKEGRLAAAVQELEQLSGEPAQVAQPWLNDARTRLAANEATNLLTGQAIARLAGAQNGGVAQ